MTRERWIVVLLAAIYAAVGTLEYEADERAEARGRYPDPNDLSKLEVTFLKLLGLWVWPAAGDVWIFVLLGLMSALIGYSLSQAYRLGTAAVVAS